MRKLTHHTLVWVWFLCSLTFIDADRLDAGEGIHSEPPAEEGLHTGSGVGMPDFGIGGAGGIGPGGAENWMNYL